MPTPAGTNKRHASCPPRSLRLHYQSSTTAHAQLSPFSLHASLPIFLAEDRPPPVAGEPGAGLGPVGPLVEVVGHLGAIGRRLVPDLDAGPVRVTVRSEEHTSELQSRQYLVCRLPLEQTNGTPPVLLAHCVFIISQARRRTRSCPLFPYTPLFRSSSPRIVRPRWPASQARASVRSARLLNSSAILARSAGVWFRTSMPGPSGSRSDRKSTRLNSSHANTSYADSRWNKQTARLLSSSLTASSLSVKHDGARAAVPFFPTRLSSDLPRRGSSAPGGRRARRGPRSGRPAC